MGFDKGTLTFTRFDTACMADATLLGESLLDTLQNKAIDRDAIVTSDNTRIGWTAGLHIHDTAFDFGKNVIADGLSFALRVDTRKVPADVIQAYELANQQAMLEASGREFLSKAEKREAREQALDRAAKDATASDQYLRTKTYPVVWNIATGTVYLGTSSNGVCDDFMMLFRETFEQSLTRQTAGELAGRLAFTETAPQSFNDVKPAEFTKPTADCEISDGEILGENRCKDFLGNEFLAWVWFRSHTESAAIRTRLGHDVTVLFDHGMTLECPYHLTGSTSIKSDSPTRTTEARAALAVGKLPTRCGLQIAADGELFGLTLHGKTLGVSGLRLAGSDDVTGPRDAFEDRINKLRSLTGAIDDLYALFLKQRLSAQWDKTRQAMVEWMLAAE